MSDITHRRVATNGIELHVAEAGPRDGRPVVLLHGFPELWYSWRHQLPALADAGYRVICPTLRGYGDSDRPDRVEDYGIRQLTGDVLGLLDEAGHERAVIVGHDWGALITWDMARLHPDRVAAACAMSVPFFNPPVPPTQMFEAISGGGFFYILYFQEVGPAEKELEADPRDTMAKILYAASGDGMGDVPTPPEPRPREGTGFLTGMSGPPSPLPSWLTDEDIDTYAAAYAKSGFFGPVSYYRNLDANWELTHPIPVDTMAMPTGFIAGKKDPVIAITSEAAIGMMQDTLPDFRGATLVDGAGHWNQQEKPAETNAALLDFLGGV